MNKLASIPILVLCLALAVGSASGQQGGGIVEGVWSDAPAVEPTVPANLAPLVVPAGKYLVDGILSDSPAPPSHPAPESTPAPTLYQDGMPVGGHQEVKPPSPKTGEAFTGTTESTNGSTDACVPHSLISLNFDEQSQPIGFANTVALRYEYRSRWVLFDGPAANDGGAILDQGSNFGVSGYSAPNFLAFNTTATLSDGGNPRPPEQVYFLGKATYVELSVGSNTSAGQPVTIEVFDDHDVSLATLSTTLATALKKLSVSAKDIYRLEIRTPATVFVMDNLAFVPQAYPLLVDFDDISAPSLFANTTALTNSYWMYGAVFSGPVSKDGGAILNSGSGFGVSGFSSPNFLAFNSTATMSDGGTPRPPETIQFQFPVSFVQLYVGSNSGPGLNLTMEAFDASGASLGTATRALQPRLRPLTLNTPKISKVVLSSSAAAFVVDDLIFVKQGAMYIDFDESVRPSGFLNATALRNTYESCRTLFNGPAAKDGGAILDQDGNFGVSNFTARNFLAFNSTATLSDGGFPVPPEEITFSRPVDSIQFFVGSLSSSGTNISLQAFDKNNNSLGSRTITLQPKLRLLGLHAPGIRRVVVSTTAQVFVVDSFNIRFGPLSYLPMLFKE